MGATHNVLLAAALASGETLIENAAREPEVGDVAHCLVKMGALIEGIGTSTLRIQGRDRLEGAVHTVLPDRIETGTFAFAVAATGGDVVLEGTRGALLETAFARSERNRRQGERNRDRRAHHAQRQRARARDRRDAAVPGLPDGSAGPAHGADDARASGTSVIRETIFENRFMHVQGWPASAPTSSFTATRRRSRA